MNPVRAVAYARRHRPRFVAELKEFVRFPSVSHQPELAHDLRRCASWLANHLRNIGLERVQVIPTKRHPIVYASWRRARGKPTILIYGHYDVQPADPLNLWRTPPFEPVVKGDNLYGRGASDDKGQMFTHVKALESYMKTERRLPVNVNCIFEGEEELGGIGGLESFVHSNQSALRADAAVMSDTFMPGPEQPAIGHALRGDLRFELDVRGPRQDLHSGNFGGVVHNPLQALCEILATLHDGDGRVAIPGFYDKVREWNTQEREYMQKIGPRDPDILRNAGASVEWGESGYSLYERIGTRPSLSLNGISGGYQGPGIKTIIPAKASAKLSIRIVPDQIPREIERLLREHIARATPPGISARVKTLASSSPALVNRNHPAMKAAAYAYRKGFGTWPVFIRSGGTIPAASIFQKELGIPTVLMGFALPNDNLHAPNEKFHLPNFYRGIETAIWYLAVAARMRNLRRHLRPQEKETL